MRVPGSWKIGKCKECGGEARCEASTKVTADYHYFCSNEGCKHNEKEGDYLFDMDDWPSWVEPMNKEERDAYWREQNKDWEEAVTHKRMEESRYQTVDVIATVNEQGIDVLTPISAINPNIRTPSGNAWRMSPTLFPDEYIGAWIVHAPAYSELQQFFLVELLSLKAAKKEIKLTGATHEFIISAVPKQLLFFNLIPAFPTEIFVGQFYAKDTDIAYSLVISTLCEICMGELDPMSKYKEKLVLRFGNSHCQFDETTEPIIIIPENDLN